MIDGHVPQPRPEDMRPTRQHLVLIGVFLLLVPLFLVTCAFHPEMLLYSARVWNSLVLVVFTAGFLFFAHLLGGPRKLWADWLDRNWYGYFWVLRQTKPNYLVGHFVNAKNLPNAVMPGWSLNVPLGGWFARPFLSHPNNNPWHSRSLRITNVIWDWRTGTVGMVTVRDRSGNVRTTQPTNLFGELETVFPEGDAYNQMHAAGLEYLAVAAETREHRLAREIANRTEAFQQQHALAAAGIGVIWETIWDIQETNRLDGVKSSEGRTVRTKLTANYRNLESMPGADTHAFGLLLPKDKKSVRPDTHP